MSESEAGKGDDKRPTNRKKWDEAEYWKNLEKRKRAKAKKQEESCKK